MLSAPPTNPSGLLLWVLSVGLLVLKGYALVDCARRPAGENEGLQRRKAFFRGIDRALEPGGVVPVDQAHPQARLFPGHAGKLGAEGEEIVLDRGAHLVDRAGEPGGARDP